MEIRKTVRLRDESTGKMHTLDIWQARDAEGKRVFTWSEYDGKMHRQPMSAHFRSIKALLEATQEDWAKDAQHEQEDKFYDEKVKRGLAPAPEEIKIYEWEV